MINLKTIWNRPFLSKLEWKFFVEFIDIMWEKKIPFFIFAQVKLSTLINNVNYDRRLFWKINKKHIDFILTDKLWNLLWLIELNDSTHNRKDRIESDNFKKQLFWENIYFVNVKNESYRDDILKIIIQVSKNIIAKKNIKILDKNYQIKNGFKNVELIHDIQYFYLKQKYDLENTYVFLNSRLIDIVDIKEQKLSEKTTIQNQLWLHSIDIIIVDRKWNTLEIFDDFSKDKDCNFKKSILETLGIKYTNINVLKDIINNSKKDFINLVNQAEKSISDDLIIYEEIINEETILLYKEKENNTLDEFNNNIITNSNEKEIVILQNQDTKNDNVKKSRLIWVIISIMMILMWIWLIYLWLLNNSKNETINKLKIENSDLVKENNNEIKLNKDILLQKDLLIETKNKEIEKINWKLIELEKEKLQTLSKDDLEDLIKKLEIYIKINNFLETNKELSNKEKYIKMQKQYLNWINEILIKVK